MGEFVSAVSSLSVIMPRSAIMKEVFSARWEGDFSGPGWGGLREPRFYRFEYYPNCVKICVYIVEIDS